MAIEYWIADSVPTEITFAVFARSFEIPAVLGEMKLAALIIASLFGGVAMIVSLYSVPDKGHWEAIGATGSGKTSRVAIPFVLQQIDVAGESEDRSVTVFDGKGDEAFFSVCRERAEKSGLPFRVWTAELGKAHHAFNPLTQKVTTELSDEQKADIAMKCMGLVSRSAEPKERFFESYQKRLLERLFSFSEALSIRQQSEYVEHNPEVLGRSQKMRDLAEHLRSQLHNLGKVGSINVTAADAPQEAIANSIDCLDSFLRPQVTYFWCESGDDVARVVANFYMELSKKSARMVPKQKRLYQAWLIDEAQRWVGADLEVFLQQARSAGIGVGLLHQTARDFWTPDGRLKTVVEENISYQVTMSTVSLEQREELMRKSGEEPYWKRSYSAGPQGSSVTESQDWRQRIDQNTAIRVTASNDHAFVTIPRPRNGKIEQAFGGQTQIVRLPYCMSMETYVRLENEPWPTIDTYPGMLKCTREGVVYAEPTDDVFDSINEDLSIIGQANEIETTPSFDFEAQAQAFLNELQLEREGTKRNSKRRN